MQAALVGIVKAVLAMDLFQVFPKNRLVGKNHFAVVTAMWLVSAVQVEMVLQ